MIRRIALSVAFVVAGACGTASDDTAPEPVPSRAVGLIVELQSEGDDIRGFILETETEERYEVLIDPQLDYGFDLSHLREHERLEQPVEVALEQREDGIYATEILDA